MSTQGYKDRLLEIHGINMWNTFHVDRAIQFAKQFHLTGIIFHCNELIDKVVFPDKYFSKDELLSFNPVRNSVTKNYRYYLKAILERCQENGLSLIHILADVEWKKWLCYTLLCGVYVFLIKKIGFAVDTFLCLFLMLKLTGQKAVSYTHLDVYKRQT